SLVEEVMPRDPLVLDPTARRRGEEEKVLHLAEGPVLVDILGELAWAVADPDLLARLLADPPGFQGPAAALAALHRGRDRREVAAVPPGVRGQHAHRLRERAPAAAAARRAGVLR